MTSKSANSVTTISLERPASVKRLLPSIADDGWMLSDYYVGSENAALMHLFDEATLDRLTSLSPVVLYGEQGTGKTALAITLAVRWARATKARPLCFATGKTFAHSFASAVEIDDVGSFRQKHRNARLLVIDELESLINSSISQPELVATLDALQEIQAPVIIATSKLPASYPGISDDLASRLSGGFSMPLLRPELPTREAMLKALAADLAIDSDDLFQLCKRFDKDLKASELKTIVKVVEQNMSSDGSLDLHMIEQLIKQLFAGDGLSVSQIAKVVARKMRVKLSDMRGSTRVANIVRARGLATLLARKLTPISLQQIGEFFGGRDHSTVLHSVRKTSKLLESDPELSKVLSEVQSELLG